MPILQAKPSETPPLAIAIVVSRFNEVVTSSLLSGAIERLTAYGFSEKEITVVEVPGAVEIPIICQRLAASKAYPVIITLGAVVKGETAHFEYVSQYVTEGVREVSIKFDIPIILGVLTTYTQAQAIARTNGEHANIGQECVDTALEMVSVLTKVS